MKTEDIGKSLDEPVLLCTHVLKESGRSYWKAPKRLELNKKIVKLRYQLSFPRKDWVHKQWSKIVQTILLTIFVVVFFESIVNKKNTLLLMPYINIYFKNYMFLIRKDRKVNKYKRYNVLRFILNP